MHPGKYMYIVLALAALVPLAIIAQAAAAEEATYVGNQQCKVCHNSKEGGAIWDVWKSKDHPKAFEKLSSDKAKAVAEKQGLKKPANESPECLQCHTTAYDAKAGTWPDKIKKEDGVECEACHGPASLHVADGKKFKFQKDTSVNMAAHIIRPDEKTCVKCHNDKNPTWDPNRYTLPDGKKVGFDYKQAWAKIEHKIPNKQQKPAGSS